MLQEWEWSERYPEQAEILRYLEHVAKRHDLKRDMQFNTRVTAAEFDEETNLWTVHTDKGDEVTARYLITAVGTLSTTNLPQFKGLDTLQGQMVSHQPLSSLRRRLHRQTGGRGRHRRHRGAGDSGNRAAGQASHCVPAHRQLLCAGAQRQGGSRK